jgi:ADP-heptose:LPS heptosyltransferase
MSLLSKLVQARSRRRSSATFDSRLRVFIRSIERQTKFLFLSPLALFIRPRRATIPLDISKVHNVLILRYDALGDAVLSSAVWHAVRKYGPHIHIGVVASRRNQALIKADSAVNDVFLFSKALSWHIMPEIWRARRAAKWDVVLNISFHDKTRAALYSKLVAPKAVTVTTVHKHYDRYRRIYSFVGHREGGIPMVLQWLSLFEQTFGIMLSESETFPMIYADAEIEGSFSAEIAAKLLAENKQEYIVINTDAAQAFREWGLDNALELSKQIGREHPQLKIFWTSAPMHADSVEAFLHRNQARSIEYLLTPSVHHLLVAVKNAIAVISPDTSVVHIAAAFKRPTVGLYVEHKEYPIRGTVNKMVFALNRQTTKSIPVQDVFNAFEEILRNAT